MKIFSDLVDNKVAKNNIQHTEDKSNEIDKQIPDATILIHVNQYNTAKQNLDKKNWRC